MPEPSTGADIAQGIDWSNFGKVDQTLDCRCGARFRSHAKLETVDGRMILVSKDACPGCGSHRNLWRAEGDPEQWGVR